MKKLIYLMLLFCPLVSAVDKAIDIQMIDQPRSIAEILAIQKTMVMSETPKQLSSKPQAICFNAKINEFLPQDVHKPKPIYGCIFSDQVAMNAALLRAGLYVHTTMGMATDQKLFSSNLMAAVGGHDFAGEELVNYNKQSRIAEDTLPEHKKFKEIEGDFDQQVIKPIIQQHKANFIFFAIINTKKHKENLSHELLHAQYYNVPQIRDLLLTVWLRVLPDDQKVITESLRNGGYDMQQQELLLREFYSYFLQHNAKEYLTGIKVLAPMAHLAEVYAPKIRKALSVANIKVLEIS
jgi:hypothetical protein